MGCDLLKYYCSKCGSDRVWYAGWIAYNPEVTGEDYSGGVPDQDDWCDGCQDYTQITDCPPTNQSPEGAGGNS